MACRQDNSQAPQVYGFLCEKTNVFYAFESLEEYQQFLAWLEEESRQEEPQLPQLPEPIVNEDELKAGFDDATAEIMRVFDDPVFKA